MKRLKYILFCLMALLCLGSCTCGDIPTKTGLPFAASLIGTLVLLLLFILASKLSQR